MSASFSVWWCPDIFFLYVTTSEKKNGFLLIEIFRNTKLWPPGSILGGHFLYVRDCKNSAFLSTLSTLETMWEDSWDQFRNLVQKPHYLSRQNIMRLWLNNCTVWKNYLYLSATYGCFNTYCTCANAQSRQRSISNLSQQSKTSQSDFRHFHLTLWKP